MWEPYEVKAQTIKTAIESATLLLRIDDIVSGIAKKNKLAPGQSSRLRTSTRCLLHWIQFTAVHCVSWQSGVLNGDSCALPFFASQ